MDFNFSAFEDSNITMKISEGIYYFEGKAIYFIEHIEEQNSEYVLVYNVHDPNAEFPVKKYQEQKHVKTIEGGTLLSDIIKSRLPKKGTLKRIYDEPVFMANIIPQGVDTVKGTVGKGFFERTADNVVYKDKGRVYKPGKYTGIFIGLSNIKWIRNYTPLESVVEYYNVQKENRDNVRDKEIL